ncbi:preprotein translocase subunit SecE [Helicobacter sp. MIT 03-1614]|jgi:preprotein translocase subunit SecE|uniref:Protein translocase subunit SecE n=1 Tax=Helicobacter hepaticus (strain ATCC 51449 / 3B1) TaxID=235279 RepID=Q7VJ76_HELHP|nr:MULTISPECIES: preprotein translocase subunit SecE [Helicobacter]AAP76964.1 preprotein translocase [Helicobacter hepaticus ATCC 51449]MCX2716462.1 preprotein translocase subunit SecE [Helicobacter sp. MIT 21-1697]TLD87472.1 preprotein translocase subunit SecE [Helicobacter sp. MIT 03-1614]
MFKKIKTYFQNANEERLKVIFPTKEQIRNASVSVLIVVSVITLFLALVDWILFHSVSSIL